MSPRAIRFSAVIGGIFVVLALAFLALHARAHNWTVEMLPVTVAAVLAAVGGHLISRTLLREIVASVWTTIRPPNAGEPP